jgi:transposase
MKRGAGVARHYLSASRWLERFLAELGLEVRTGDPAEIKAKRVKKQKTDRED